MCPKSHDLRCVACGQSGHLSTDCPSPPWCPLRGLANPLHDEGQHDRYGRCKSKLSLAREWFFGKASLQLRRWPMAPWKKGEKQCLTPGCRRRSWITTFKIGSKRRRFCMVYCCRRCMYAAQTDGENSQGHGTYCSGWKCCKQDHEQRKKKRKRKISQ